MSKQSSTNLPMIGTWKLNLAKSTYSPGPAPKSIIAKFEPWEDGVKATQDVIDPQGNKLHIEFTAKFDGKDYPLKGHPLADAISVKQAGERQFDIVWKKNGKVTLTGKSVISADGKTTTLTQTGTDAQGRTINNMIITEKL
jgi:hypothetical protein